MAVTADGPAFVEGNILSDLSTPQKLLGTGAWTDARFRASVLSWLKPLQGERITLDPGRATTYERVGASRPSVRPSASM